MKDLKWKYWNIRREKGIERLSLSFMTYEQWEIRTKINKKSIGNLAWSSAVSLSVTTSAKGKPNDRISLQSSLHKFISCSCSFFFFLIIKIDNRFSLTRGSSFAGNLFVPLFLWNLIESKREKEKEMGRLFVVTLDGSIYSCKHCKTHLALSDDIISKVHSQFKCVFINYAYVINNACVCLCVWANEMVWIQHVNVFPFL